MKMNMKKMMSGIAEGTNFTSETTNHGNNENGPAGLPLMSDEGKKLASVSAPCNSYEIYKSSTPAVREK